MRRPILGPEERRRFANIFSFCACLGAASSIPLMLSVQSCSSRAQAEPAPVCRRLPEPRYAGGSVSVSCSPHGGDGGWCVICVDAGTEGVRCVWRTAAEIRACE